VRLQEIKTILATHFKSCLYLPVRERGNVVAMAMPYAIPWQRIHLKKKDISALSKRYNLNFQEIVQVAKRTNLSVSERIAAWLG
jgi:Mor family transcriptional regulator